MKILAVIAVLSFSTLASAKSICTATCYVRSNPELIFNLVATGSVDDVAIARLQEKCISLGEKHKAISVSDDEKASWLSAALARGMTRSNFVDTFAMEKLQDFDCDVY